MFAMQLLMKEKCKVPDRETAIAVMKKHLGDDLDFSDDKGNSIIFSVNQYKMTYETGTIAPILMSTDCCKTDHEKLMHLSEVRCGLAQNMSKFYRNVTIRLLQWICLQA